MPSQRSPSHSRAFFYPFVALPSLHISDRYGGCKGNGGEILVMREGSWPGRFALSMRGQIFFTTLRQFVPPSSPLRLRLHPYSHDFFTYHKLSRHRAAVWVPLAHCCKMTFNDLITMEMPLFMPSAALQGSISARWQCKNHYNIAGEYNFRVRVLDQCQTEELDRWLPLSHFARYPHIKRFDSVVDLAGQLASASCGTLEETSGRMAAWNRAVLEDDVSFWNDAVAALRAAPGRPAKRSLPVLPQLNFPQEPSALDCQPQASGAIAFPEAAHCNLHAMSHEWRWRCCETAAQLAEWEPERIAALALAALPPGPAPSGRCLWQPSACDPALLKHGTHLFQGMPLGSV